MTEPKLKEDDLFEVLRYGRCSCGKYPGTELHTCPYGEEINNNFSLCNCCDECTQNCADDI